MTLNGQTIRALKRDVEQDHEDPRMGVSSASSLERVYLCRGSRNLERGLRELPKEDAVRESGSRVHAALSGEIEVAALDDDELWMLDKCKEIEDLVLSVSFPGVDLLTIHSFSEDRLYLEVDGEIVNSGEFDKLYVDTFSGKMLIIDYKTGYLPVTKAEENYQLRNYAVLCWLYYREKFGITEIEVTAVQPRCYPQFARCKYTTDDLEMALREMLILLKKSDDPAAERTPSIKACTYCKALSVCPEARQKAKAGLLRVPALLKLLPPPPTTEFTREHLEHRESIVSGEELAKAKLELAYADKLKAAVDAELKARLSVVGATNPIYKLVIKRGNREVKDPYALYEKLKQYISPRDILAAAKFTVGKIDEWMAARAGYPKTKGKVATEEYLGDLVQPGEQRIQLEQIKE